MAKVEDCVRRYLWPLPHLQRQAVVMIDGKMSHGGLTDRFRHILSVYSYCKDNGIPFRLYYVYPCDLTDILVPAGYDWRIRPDQLSRHFLDSGEIDLYVDKEGCDEEFNARHLGALDEAFGRTWPRQYRIYGNAFFGKGRYRDLFNELFRPSPYLEERINRYAEVMDEPYESITLRFQRLLGDFDEGNYPILSPEGQNDLIRRCADKVDKLYRQGYFHTVKVLITSDSVRFLNHMAQRNYVYTIPGKLEHMDYTQNPDLEINAKPFIDLFLLREASRLTLLQTGDMYRSGFPAFAAELGGKPYQEILF